MLLPAAIFVVALAARLAAIGHFGFSTLRFGDAIPPEPRT